MRSVLLCGSETWLLRADTRILSIFNLRCPRGSFLGNAEVRRKVPDARVRPLEQAESEVVGTCFASVYRTPDSLYTVTHGR